MSEFFSRSLSLADNSVVDEASAFFSVFASSSTRRSLDWIDADSCTDAPALLRLTLHAFASEAEEEAVDDPAVALKSFPRFFGLIFL